ncbi:primase C-terminal domain-containing protein [uncultured Bacteroides sp.]|uniref:primase C-terminal domain-containing protein n=1 Tax=uncultured Bacteroides sp. TaxID=162156 RepID=UPI0025D4AF76|nr:primase C-terminal domain-containing protein [uncultured Bacteroides sp.]
MSHIFLNPLTAGQRHSNVFKLACENCRQHYPQKTYYVSFLHFSSTQFFIPKNQQAFYHLNTSKLINTFSLLPRQRVLLLKGHKDKRTL